MTVKLNGCDFLNGMLILSDCAKQSVTDLKTVSARKSAICCARTNETGMMNVNGFHRHRRLHVRHHHKKRSGQIRG